ncbi:MAG: hemin uptake protein HemP [Sedimentisphaerales bacterium]|nr:hemin uptake protein HemP [Sedimentisphaerales bacterium]
MLDSRVLFGGKKVIGIQHEGFVYKLRITKHGKLILNK